MKIGITAKIAEMIKERVKRGSYYYTLDDNTSVDVNYGDYGTIEVTLYLSVMHEGFPTRTSLKVESGNLNDIISWVDSLVDDELALPKMDSFNKDNNSSDNGNIPEVHNIFGTINGEITIAHGLEIFKDRYREIKEYIVEKGMDGSTVHIRGYAIITTMKVVHSEYNKYFGNDILKEVFHPMVCSEEDTDAIVLTDTLSRCFVSDSVLFFFFNEGGKIGRITFNF